MTRFALLKPRFGLLADLLLTCSGRLQRSSVHGVGLSFVRRHGIQACPFGHPMSLFCRWMFGKVLPSLVLPFDEWLHHLGGSVDGFLRGSHCIDLQCFGLILMTC